MRGLGTAAATVSICARDLADDVDERRIGAWKPASAPVRYDVFGKMEVTIHETEVTDLLPLLIEMAENARHEYKSEQFPNGVVTPHYSWSTKAQAEYEAQKAAREMRRLR